MHMDANEVTDLRTRLKMDKTTFAKFLGTDVRTVTRWEKGEATPSGPAEAVMVGVRESIQKQGDADAIIKVILGAVAVGGLAYLLVKLLDSLSVGTSPR
jgi:DNA-binding transcriptional regulator YiaG